VLVDVETRFLSSIIIDDAVFRSIYMGTIRIPCPRKVETKSVKQIKRI